MNPPVRYSRIYTRLMTHLKFPDIYNIRDDLITISRKQLKGHVPTTTCIFNYAPRGAHDDAS